MRINLEIYSQILAFCPQLKDQLNPKRDKTVHKCKLLASGPLDFPFRPLWFGRSSRVTHANSSGENPRVCEH